MTAGTLSDSLKRVHQRASHAHLLPKNLSRSSEPPKRGRLDAVIVPASRPACFLQPAIELAASLGVVLVVLCSMQTKVEQVAKRVARTPGGRALIVPIPRGWEPGSFPKRTSAPEFQEAKAHRINDLSAKRNLGLLLARLQGWNKIAFVDDDITLSGSRSMARLAGQLDEHEVAGMVVQDFPDNSVVCHARRLAGFWQDVFVTGAVLGVRCNSRHLSFFPDIYNEDWFFFAKQAAAHNLPRAGHARQAEYDPFATPDRACHEEFGDLLAEGLFALIGLEHPSVPIEKQLHTAKEPYWSQFIDARYEVLTETQTRLDDILDQDSDGRLYSALASLAAARKQLEQTIKADLCVSFMDAWRRDLNDWHKFSNGLGNVGSFRAAMDCLELKTWTLAKFGAEMVDSETAAIDSDAALVNSGGSVVGQEHLVLNRETALADSERAEDRHKSLVTI